MQSPLFVLQKTHDRRVIKP